MTRVIDHLRKTYGGTWTFDPNNSHIARRVWIGPSFIVYRVAALAPKYDGDDESYELRYYRTDTLEQIYVPRSR